MKYYKLIILSLLMQISIITEVFCGNVVKIVVSPEADRIEQLAAEKLLSYLTKIYPSYKFKMATNTESAGMQIFVGNSGKLIKMGLNPDVDQLFNNESFSVQVRKLPKSNICLITGKESRGTLNGVYALLEKLGCGFYLSYETLPTLKTFTFDEWPMNDSPLVEDRIVFNWHNFLSGCTVWSLADWKLWIDQSSKMRYNSIMVHAYGNNPMFSFEFNGISKPVGYMNTSASGRDWGAQHLNDVRLLPGGNIYKEAVLGSEAATVADENRVSSAISLMQKVFKYAHQQGMKVIYAHDIDTKSANPQSLILTLPQNARFKVGEDWLANPETPEGYKFYKEQVKTLFDFYPEIDKLALWVRWSDDQTPWRQIRKSNFPDNWTDEYYDLLKNEWKLLDDSRTVTTFAISKVITAFQKALKELGHSEVEVMYGSWGWDDMVPANDIISKDVTFIPLDWWINFEYQATEKKLSEIAGNRKLIPVVWAHHDDHRFIGRPYTPYPQFADLLEKRGASGYSVIHWTTFPLDFYFSSLSNQVWKNSKNESLDTTIKKFVVRNWGKEIEPLTKYFKSWVVEGPMFGRETSDHFMDLGGAFAGKERFESTRSIIDKSIDRLKIIHSVDKSQITKNSGVIKYFEGSELFYISFFTNQIRFDNAWSSLANNDLKSAVKELSTCDEEKTLELFSGNIQNGPGSIGEKAVLFSMGTRWYPDFINIRQRAGMLPVKYKFGATQHDPLAQSSGKHTWFIDKDKSFWSVLGYKELGKGSFKVDANSRSFIEVDSTLRLNLCTISGDRLTEGEYLVSIDISGNTKNLPDIELPSSNIFQKYSVQNLGDLRRLYFSIYINKGTNQIRINFQEKTALYKYCIQKQ